MNDLISPELTADLAAEHGLRPEEYALIERALGRRPTLVELGIYSVMWSEHCAYKHTRPLLKTLPTEGPKVVVGPGENAGAIDLGDGLCVVFKMESHNHPSAVEPYEGAATGVGGILRDIFTMGARPVALADCLRFGLDGDGKSTISPRTRQLVEGVVEGIAGYGNCVGIPTVAGDIQFDPAYNGNILVNAMCVGVAETSRIIRANAQGPGNQVLYFGSATGRDGIHGATFASEELTDEAMERRSAVQVGDPFMGKKILEATLELIERGLVVGIQDMGAAGLTCSTCEMAGRAGTGVSIELDRVPQRARGMSAYEIMLSESQERMLAVCRPDQVDAALEVCERWECGGAIIGEVTDDGRVRVAHGGELVADLPAAQLTEDAPVYHPEEADPLAPINVEGVGDQPVVMELTAPPVVERGSLKSVALRYLSWINNSSKRWIFGRYDHQVGAATVLRPGEADAAVLRLRGDANWGAAFGGDAAVASSDRSDKYLAITGGGNGRYVARDPKLGATLAVLEASRNLACVGAEPLGVTNCLNFSSPEKPRGFGTLKRAIEGIGEGCQLIDAPVTGGNVSLYNEDNNGLPVLPTPMIGMMGQVPTQKNGEAHITPAGFQREGDVVALLGPPVSHEIDGGLGGTELMAMQRGVNFQSMYLEENGHKIRRFEGRLPEVDLELEVRMQRTLREAIALGLVKSAHDVSDGGLFLGLLESCLLGGEKGRTGEPSGLGVELTLPESVCASDAAWTAFWFAELPPRILVSVSPDQWEALQNLAAQSDVPLLKLGTTRPEAIAGLEEPDLSLAELRENFFASPV